MIIGELVTVGLIFFFLLAIRVPVAVSMAFTSLVGLAMLDLNALNAVTQLYRGLDSFVLLAVPFFLLLGLLAANSSISTRLLELSALLTARLRGGVGHLNVVLGVFMSGLSGSATADAAGVGALLIPMMKKRGYSAEYAAALTAAVSTLASVIPPSIIMIIYGAYAQVSIGALFIGGIIPGLMCAVLFMFLNYFHAARRKIDFGSRDAVSEVLGEIAVVENATSTSSTAARTPVEVDTQPAPVPYRPRVLTIIWRAVPALMIPILLRGGIGLGYFTATEAGLLAVIYVIVLIAVFYRELKWRAFIDTIVEAVRFYSLPLIAAGMATVLAFVVTVMGGADLVRDAVQAVDIPAWAYLLMVVVIFLIVGAFLDAFPAIVLFTPILLPGADALGIHPVQMGLIIVLTMAIGLVTPPYGLCLLITAKIAKASLLKTAVASLPFLGAMLGVVLLMVFSPEFATWLPRLVYPDLF